MSNIYYEITKKKDSKNSKKIFVNIIDIDECIIDSLFRNFPMKEEKVQTPEEIDHIVQQVNEQGSKIALYPEFIKFYFNSAPRTLKNIFITGRKASHFKTLTKEQLSPLNAFNHYHIEFYEEAFDHTKQEYSAFKVGKVSQCIISSYILFENPIIRVFDDYTEYYEDLFLYLANERAFTFNVLLYQIHSNEDWNKINDHIYSIIGTEEILTCL